MASQIADGERFTLMFFILLFLLGPSAEAITNIQNTTSIGVYRDIEKNYHYPLYHNWALQGLYGGGVETSFEFLLNNDFYYNRWLMVATEAKVEVPFLNQKSRLQMGRQLLTDGFDMALLDGVRSPVYFNENFSIIPTLGSLHSPDVELINESSSPFAGISLLSNLLGTEIQFGQTARNDSFNDKFSYCSVSREFSSLPLKPSALTKGEWNSHTGKFNQGATELTLQLSPELQARGFHSYLQPRPRQPKENENFLYRLISISPTESFGGDLLIQISDSSSINFGAKQFFFETAFKSETGTSGESVFSHSLSSVQALQFSIYRLQSYGGDITDLGCRYIHNLSTQSKAHFEYDVAYLSKINNITTWAQHARAGYERSLFSRAKGQLLLEAERNHYYQFDVRTVAYVTSYF